MIIVSDVRRMSWSSCDDDHSHVCGGLVKKFYISIADHAEWNSSRGEYLPELDIVPSFSNSIFMFPNFFSIISYISYCLMTVLFISRLWQILNFRIGRQYISFRKMTNLSENLSLTSAQTSLYNVPHSNLLIIHFQVAGTRQSNFDFL